MARNKPARFTGYWLLLALLLTSVLGAGCEELASLQTHPISYAQFSAFQYYKLKDTNKIAVEFFFVNSYTALRKVVSKIDREGARITVHLYFTGYGGGNDSKMFAFNTENKTFTYIDVDAADASNLRVVYDDQNGEHQIAYAGTLNKPFDLWVPKPFTDPLTDVIIGAPSNDQQK